MRLLLFAVFALLCQVPGRAQSLRWDPRFGAPGGTDGVVRACVMFDDGTGPALIVGGSFTQAGNVFTQNVAKLGPQGWEQMGAGLGSYGQTVTALEVFDDGSGPKLYAAGGFSAYPGATSQVMRWNGSQWVAAGTGSSSTCISLAVYDDGSGPKLYAGGDNVGSSGGSRMSLTRLIAGAWVPVTASTNTYVNSMIAWNDGTGSKLYIGSGYSAPDGVKVWDGTTWSAMPGSPSFIGSLCVYDDGTGEALFAGGAFAGGVKRWNGSTWSVVGGGIPASDLLRFAIHDDGSGTALYANSISQVMRLVNGAWVPVGTPFNNVITMLFSGDAGSGPRLFVGGSFNQNASAFVSHFCAWDGSSYQIPGPAPGFGVEGHVHAFAARIEGGIPTLYVGGYYEVIGNQMGGGVARYQQGQWTQLGPYGPGGEALTFFDEGSGPVLIAAGSSGVFRWTGGSWTMLGGGLSGQAYTGHALAEYDDGTGPGLFVGGAFTIAGGVPSPNIARWSGSSWSALGGGVNGEVFALAVYDPGTGPRLYVTGTFLAAGSVGAGRIASWDGSAWQTLGSGLDSHGYALAVFDDGSGPALYVGGFFTHASGQLVNGIAKWNGTSFAPVGGGFGGAGYAPGVRTLTVFDDGSGPKLYAGGQFASAGGHPASGVARWSGTEWSALGGGTDGFVDALLPFDDSTAGGNVLMVGGTFGHASALDSTGIAEWHAGFSTITEFCVGDGSSGHCPCWNDGQPGRGCENSNWTGGGKLSASGSPNPDTLVLQASELLPSVSVLAVQGDTLLYDPVFLGDGLRCVGGHLKRMYVSLAVGGAVDLPGPTDPTISQRSAALGDPLLPGSVRTYQIVYRDPDPLFCVQGGNRNVTNAVRVVW